jgi:hypothetical protein
MNDLMGEMARTEDLIKCHTKALQTMRRTANFSYASARLLENAIIVQLLRLEELKRER